MSAMRRAKVGMRLLITGGDVKIELDEDQLVSCRFTTDTPVDGDAEIADTMIIRGKIMKVGVDASAEETMKLMKWATLKAGEPGSYMEASVETFFADRVIRRVVLPKAFVVSYVEDFLNVEGIGDFELKIRQKEDESKNIMIEGGYGL